MLTEIAHFAIATTLSVVVVKWMSPTMVWPVPTWREVVLTAVVLTVIGTLLNAFVWPYVPNRFPRR